MTPIRKQVIPTQNRHSTFRKERIADVKRETTIGRYSKLLPEKKPRNFKKMKAPLEIYKDETIRKAIKHLMDLYAGKIEKSTNNGNVTRKELWFSFCDLQKELSHRNINIFNNTGQDLHLLLPLSGMSSVGYFYKAIFERLLPKARVTFLKTYSRRTNDANHFDLIELKKSINKNDKLFVMIDYISGEERTRKLISNNLSQLNKNYKLLAINSPESDTYGIRGLREEIEDRFKPKSSFSLHNIDSQRTMQKDHYFRSTLDGKDVFEYTPQAYAKKYNSGKVLKMNSAEQGINRSKLKYSEGLYKTIPGSEVYKFYTFMDEYNPKLYNFLKKLNQAKAYTYYYLGNEFANEVAEKQKK